jgi:hypothetical protein
MGGMVFNATLSLRLQKQTFNLEHSYNNNKRLAHAWIENIKVACPNKTDRHDIIGILLKVALNTIYQTKPLLFISNTCICVYTQSHGNVSVFQIDSDHDQDGPLNIHRYIHPQSSYIAIISLCTGFMLYLCFWIYLRILVSNTISMSDDICVFKQ